MLKVNVTFTHLLNSVVESMNQHAIDKFQSETIL